VTTERASDRDESREERLDRNWGELLQELRITQTGLQLLSGFLLTLSFTTTFAGLDGWQKSLYLALVLLAAVAVGVNLAPVMLHRRVFGEHVKERVVQLGHVCSQVVVGAVALLVIGIAALIFSVVINEAAAIVVAIVLVAILGTLLLVIPGRMAKQASDGH
jgi:hypothetical protein